MSEHIYHATATLTEIGLAMSIATVTKILPSPEIADPIARETAKNRIAQTDGKIIGFFYSIGCWLSDANTKIVKFSSKIPLLVFLTQLGVLIGMAFCPSHIDTWLFSIAAVGLLLMVFYIFINRETLSKTGERPLVEPVE